MELNPNGYGWTPRSYVARRASGPVVVDADLTGPVWSSAPRTDRFVHLVSGATAPLDTTAAILWDDDALHIGFWVADPAVTATLTERDALLFYENDVEVFVAGDDAYYELELNALGTVYEVLFVWRDAYRGSRFDPTVRGDDTFDVHSPRVHSFGGDHARTPTSFWTGNHPRGTRWAFLDHDLPGLQVATRVDGAVNDPAVIDRGWTAQVALPWAGLALIAGDRPVPPRAGDEWSIFVGRFQHLETAAGGETIPVGWSPSPHGVADTHVPESFLRVRFEE